MNLRSNISRFLTSALPVLLFASIVQAQPLPKSVAVGSNPPGSLFYALASGLSKVISESRRFKRKYSPMQAPAPFCRCWIAESSI